MNYWIITDPHLGHEGIVTAGHRPRLFEVRLLRSIRRTVKKEDVLICLGDVAFRHPNFWTRTLRANCAGKLWLTLGNHDKSAEYYLQRDFDFVADGISMNYCGVKVLFTHIPQAYDGIHSVQIHGHIHQGMHRAGDNLPQHDSQISICMEDHFYPYSLKALLKGK